MSEGEKVDSDAVVKAFSQPGDMANEESESQKPVNRFTKNGKRKTLSTVKSEQVEVPDDTWQVEALGEYAQVEQKHFRLRNKQMAVHIHRLGHVLTIAKAKVEKGEWVGSKNWCDFLNRYKVPVTSDWRARGLYSSCPDEKKMAGLGITKAYHKFGFLAPPKRGEGSDVPDALDSGKNKPTTDPKPDDPPPPKEDQKTLTMFLAKVLQWLEIYRDEAAFLDQDKKESPEHLRDLIDQVIVVLQQMKGSLPNVA
jgi:hypothetical protein